MVTASEARCRTRAIGCLVNWCDQESSLHSSQLLQFWSLWRSYSMVLVNRAERADAEPRLFVPQRRGAFLRAASTMTSGSW